MAEVMLVSPSSRAGYRWPPLGLGYIAAYLEKHGHETSITDIKVPWINRSSRKIKDEILRQVTSENPKFVGFPCVATEVPEVLELSASIKKELPDATIFVGGPHATVRPHDLLFGDSNHNGVDFVVIGEAEKTVLELVESSTEPKKDIPGLAFRGKSGVVVKTSPRPLIEDLDELPFPAYDKLPMDFYAEPQGGLIRGVWISGTTVLTARGCPYGCTYCSSRNIFGRKVRFRSATNLADELVMLKEKWGMDGVYLHDDSFTANRKHVVEICNELTSRKIDLIWGCETRVDIVDRELLAEMKKAGCVQIDFGVESGSQKVLDTIGKGQTVEQARRAFSLCRAAGLRSFANFMINTPGETWEDIEKTRALARELKASRYEVWVTTPYPGSELYAQFGNPKLRIDEYPDLMFGRELDLDARIKNEIFRDVNLFEFRLKMQEEFDGYASKNDKFLILRAYLPLLLRSRHKLGYARGFAASSAWWLFRKLPRAMQNAIRGTYRSIFPKPK